LRLPSNLLTYTNSLPENTSVFTLENSASNTLSAVFEEINQQHGALRIFIHQHPVWPSVEKTDDLFSPSDAQILKLIFQAAKYLKTPLSKTAESGRSAFMTVTRMNGSLGMGDDECQNPVAGGFFGLAKTINIEWPSVYCRALDLDPKLDDAESAEKIVTELHDANHRIVEVGVTNSGRFTLAAEPQSAGKQTALAPAKIDRSSVFLVSGGGKGITADCVIQLAKTYQCQFVLLGRSEVLESEPDWAKDCFDDMELKKRCMEDLREKGEKPTPVKIMKQIKPINSSREIRQTLDAMENAGSTVFYSSADITDVDGLQQKLTKILKQTGPVTGIIHGAGVLADKLIEEKSGKDFDAVYSTKVNGLKSLLNCVSLDKLENLVLFSSSAGFYGNEGQSDYAVANEILNKIAHNLKRKYPSCHVTAINWGPWDGGMVTPELKNLFEQRNIEVIPKNVGTRMMVDELSESNSGKTQIVVGSSMVVPRIPGSQQNTYRIHRAMNLADNPFLEDHAIGGEPVLPIICALAWMARSCEGLYPGYKFFRCENTRVLKGIVFNASQADDYLLEINETGNSTADEVLFDVKISSTNAQNKPIYHYSSQIILKRSINIKPIYSGVNLSKESPIEGSQLYQNGTLFHGPIFQIVRQLINNSSERLTVRCKADELDVQRQGQFSDYSFNPFTDDALLQAMLVWARQEYGFGSLPLCIGTGEFYRPINFGEEFYVTLEVKSSSKSKLVADLFAHNEMGEVFSRMQDAEVTISPNLNEKFHQPTKK
jgi:NAD(P)-dependent dehydrogenase (short-subunit alcohol dehydrogenase family)